MGDCVKIEKRFASERALFMNEIELKKSQLKQADDLIKLLKAKLEKEIKYQESLTVEDYVESLCSKAYTSYTLLNLEAT